MRKKQKNRKIIVIAIALLLLISVGYAGLTTTLTINGTANIAATTWKVYFNNLQVTDGSVTATTAPSIPENSTSTTSLSYTVTLNKPGDFYEFEVDVVNGGTINAKLAENGVTKGGVSNEDDTYVNYTVTYADVNGTAIVAGDKLSKSGATISGIGDTRRVKVRVEYDPNVTLAQLNELEDDIELNLTFALNYVQD